MIQRTHLRLIFLGTALLCLSSAESSIATLCMLEICDNGIDDDGDGLVDLNDEDCNCEGAKPFSLIPNPSFEEMYCCPQNRSQLDCAKAWTQASEATTDYINSCGWLGWPNLEPPTPYPDGDGVIGFRDGRNIQGNAEKNWKEYAGACLDAPMLSGIEYKFEFHVGFVSPSISPPINVSFFGTTNCENLPFGIGSSEFGCPSNSSQWNLLSDVKVSGSGWVKASITIIPSEDIYAIAIGPPCEPTTSSENLYYFFDNLVLAESKLFGFDIKIENGTCTDDFRLSLREGEGLTYQWYRNGIAILGETNNYYYPQMKDGTYSAVIYVDGVCKKTDDYIYTVPIKYEYLNETICVKEEYEFGDRLISEPGIYYDTLQTYEQCDSIILLDLFVQGVSQTEVNAKVFQGETYSLDLYDFHKPGTYNLNLISSIGCDSLIKLNLALYDIFIPNIFSPNDDGVNDVFEVYSNEPLIKLERLEIFSRWGSKVYQNESSTSDIAFSWDGTLNQQKVGNGLYSYVLTLLLENGKQKLITGNVSVMK